MGGTIDKGSRFCKNNHHFMIRNRVYLPFSYYSLVLISSNVGKNLSKKMYDPSAYFCINGNTALHAFAVSFKNLSFLLNDYEKTNPKLINLLLLKNNDGKNVL
jgi:hypothetical protein